MEPIVFKELKHQVLIVEKGVDFKKLPKDVQSDSNMLKANVGRYNGNANKTEIFYNSLIKRDILLADAVLSFLEHGLPTEDEFKKKTKTVEPAPAPAPTPVAKFESIPEPVVTSAPAPAPAPPAKSDAELAEEKRLADAKAEEDRKAAEEDEKNGKVAAIDAAIMEKINASSNKTDISVRDLEAIAGRSLGTEETVGTLKLRKVFKQSFYRLR